MFILFLASDSHFVTILYRNVYTTSPSVGTAVVHCHTVLIINILIASHQLIRDLLEQFSHVMLMSTSLTFIYLLNVYNYLVTSWDLFGAEPS